MLSVASLKKPDHQPAVTANGKTTTNPLQPKTTQPIQLKLIATKEEYEGNENLFWLKDSNRSQEDLFVDPLDLYYYKKTETVFEPQEEMYEADEEDEMFLQKMHSGFVKSHSKNNLDDELIETDDVEDLKEDERFKGSLQGQGPVSVLTENEDKDAIVGSLGASPCVIVFMIVKFENGKTAIGSSHLDAHDMKTDQNVENAVNELYKDVTTKSKAKVKKVESYAVGGLDYENTDFAEYSRLLIALQNDKYNLIEAKIPASKKNGSIDAYMDSDGFRGYYKNKPTDKPKPKQNSYSESESSEPDSEPDSESDQDEWEDQSDANQKKKQKLDNDPPNTSSDTGGTVQKKQNPLSSIKPANNPLQLFSSDAAIQKKGNNTGLPDNLKDGIESLSGYSLDDVMVHYNSDKPAGLQALAYAQGTDIHVAPGQEQHLPHEAWHVVQQKQGRVNPTMQVKGDIAVNDDKGLENEADNMGNKAMQFKEHPNSNPVKNESYSMSETVQRVLIFRDEPINEERFPGLFISNSPVINGINTLKIPGMIQSGVTYKIDDQDKMKKEMKKYIDEDPATLKELALLTDAQDINQILNRHNSRPPLPLSNEWLEVIRKEEIDIYKMKLNTDLDYAGVYFRQLEAIHSKGKHIPPGLRPSSIMDHVDIKLSVEKEGTIEDNIPAETFFEKHPRIIRIIDPKSHKFIRDQFMQAITPEGKSLVLQNPNMAFDPTLNREPNEKYKANEVALEKILRMVKGDIAPEMKEMLPLEKGQHTQTSFGNMLAVPQTQDNKAGHLLVGGTSDKKISPTQRQIIEYFSSELVIINTEWLRVGHVDEIISIIPWNNSKFGFKLLVADQKMMNDKVSIIDEPITKLLDQIAQDLEGVFGKDNIVRIPAVFVQYRKRLTKDKNDIGSVFGPEPGAEKYVSAFPNMTNLMVLNDHPNKGIDNSQNPLFKGGDNTPGTVKLLVPDPTSQGGVYLYAQQEAKQMFIDIVKQSGNMIEFENDMHLHTDGGDIHCGTFEIRAT